MRTLITGGLGYLGGRLARVLSAASNDPIRLGTRRCVETVPGIEGASVVPMDWESEDSLERACAGVDKLVHLAGLDMQRCAADPVLALQVNAVATARLVRAATRTGVRRMVLVSTAHVYGGRLEGTINEETPPVSLHPYASSHRAREEVVRAANERGELAGTVIRLSNAYGPPAFPDADCWHLIINDLCRQAVSGHRLVLRSTGLQRRNFIPMGDACRAIVHVLEWPDDVGGRDVINAGSDWSPTVWEVASLIRNRCRELFGFEPELARIQPAPGETAHGLEYQSCRLEESGFRPMTDHIGEIDDLLRYCAEMIGTADSSTNTN